ncbi:SEC10/PgrA surface exclusion domain-containing protein [Granulicatella sp.]
MKADGTYAHDEEVDGYYLESNGKMRESEEAHLRRALDNSVQSQRKEYEKKSLEKAIQWLETEDSIVINDDFAKRLYQYGATDQGKNQENISALNVLSKELIKANQKEIGTISNTLLAKYNLRTMPEDMKQSLSLYAASLINSVRQQMKLSPVKVTDTMVTIAEKIAREYINDGRFIADGKGHDAYAINKVVEQYGILTSKDQSKENGTQYFENAISTDFQNQDYFTIRAELREAILLFLFNGIEYDHAQSVAGVNFGKEYKDAYFGVGLGASGHFIQIEDSYLEKEGTLPFSKAEISQKVRTDYEQKVIQRLKEHLATLQ